jgi:hypothetical protein
MASLSRQQWAAVRQLSEGAPPTSIRLGQALDISPNSLRSRAAAEGWNTPDFRSSKVRKSWADGTAGLDAGPGQAALPEGWDGMTAAGRAAWVRDAVTRRAAGLAAAMAAGQAADRRELDALGALLRVLDQSEALTHDFSPKSQTEDDASLAEDLRRIDERIVELAVLCAEWMVGQQHC